MKRNPLGWLLGILAVLTITLVALETMTSAAADIVVYKAPGCGCCERWAAHLRKSGFTVVVRAETNLDAAKTKWNVPPQFESCHTARVGDYTIEGHVPSAAIARLLKERPAIAGLAVAGMPAGAPGMEAGTSHQSYDVVAFDQAGHVSVYERH